MFRIAAGAIPLDRVNGQRAICDWLAGRNHLLVEDDAFVDRWTRRTWFRDHHRFGGLLAGACAWTLPKKCRACTGAPPDGRPCTARRSRRSAHAGGGRCDAAGGRPTISFSLTLDGQAVRRQRRCGLRRGADHRAGLVRAAGDLVQGRWTQRAAHLRGRDVRRGGAAVAPAPPRWRSRPASSWASPAAREPAGVVEQAVLVLPGDRAVRRGHRAGQRSARGGAGQPGTAEAWALGRWDAERDLRKGALLDADGTWKVAGLAQLGVRVIFMASCPAEYPVVADDQVRCREAIGC